STHAQRIASTSCTTSPGPRPAWPAITIEAEYLPEKRDALEQWAGHLMVCLPSQGKQLARIRTKPAGSSPAERAARMSRVIAVRGQRPSEKGEPGQGGHHVHRGLGSSEESPGRGDPARGSREVARQPQCGEWCRGLQTTRDNAAYSGAQKM